MIKKKITLEEIASWTKFSEEEGITPHWGESPYRYLNIRQTSRPNNVLWNSIINNFDKIVMIGFPRSGKTTLFNALTKHDNEPKHFYLHTDDYKDEEYVQQLYTIMDKLRGKPRWMMEGIQGYRFLRKYIQTGEQDLRPDLIIRVENLAIALPKHHRMRKALHTIWTEYVSMEDKLPEVIIYIHDYEYEE